MIDEGHVKSPTQVEAEKELVRAKNEAFAPKKANGILPTPNPIMVHDADLKVGMNQGRTANTPVNNQASRNGMYRCYPLRLT